MDEQENQADNEQLSEMMNEEDNDDDLINSGDEDDSSSDEEGMGDEDESENDEDGEPGSSSSSKRKRVFILGQQLPKGTQLVADESAYIMRHEFGIDNFPAYTFDYIG